ncbi:hypothetical protein D3C81_2253320 [compost metagenome]
MIPPKALAMLKAEMFAVAASSGALLPYFITRICSDGTFANEVTPNAKAATRKAYGLLDTR